ncbi:MAG: hypothetical protein QOJ59_2854, partial [Thermomicrobiales bacterium]|nr:hypothetical protein [Thermomicrobiales bacterium]
RGAHPSHRRDAHTPRLAHLPGGLGTGYGSGPCRRDIAPSVTDPIKGTDAADEQSAAPSSPADIASAARSCLVILVILATIVLLLCVAFGISQLV